MSVLCSLILCSSYARPSCGWLNALEKALLLQLFEICLKIAENYAKYVL